MTQDGAAAASPGAGEALREESGTATGPAVNWPVPQGVGPRAISQWSIVQRLSADEWKLMMNALPGRVGARARHGGNARRNQQRQDDDRRDEGFRVHRNASSPRAATAPSRARPSGKSAAMPK